MTKREAKRLALFHVALILEDARAAGWDTELPVQLEQERLGRSDPDDQKRFEDALSELIREFWRRCPR